MKVTLFQCSPNFCFELLDDAGKSIQFVQTDWEYPGLASMLGWDISKVWRIERDGFDFKAECGAFACFDCMKVFYPMELESVDDDDYCPECGEEVVEYHQCDHEHTDGTVKCSCGVEPGVFIGAAYDWLTEHDGEEFDVDESYFPE